MYYTQHNNNNTAQQQRRRFVVFFFFDTHRDAPPLPATAGVTSGCYADFGRVLTTRLAEFKQLPRRVTNLLPDFEV